MAGNLQNAKDLAGGIYTQAEINNYRTNAKSSLLKGTFSVSNTVSTAGFGTKLYTGNGSTQSINAGIDLATQWGDSANETYGGLVWVKSRSGTWDNVLLDTIRVNKYVSSNTTSAEVIPTNIGTFFNSSGYEVFNNATFNNSGSTYASWIFQTTHRVTGTTNHGKAYTCHYNPITGFTMIKYEGSGIAGHEIPHHLGRKLGFRTTKNITLSGDHWFVSIDGKYALLNLTNAFNIDSSTINTYDIFTVGYSGTVDNASGSSYITYGWANSYYNNGELNGNYEIGIYQGTGASGNKITTRGKPAWVMVKRLDSTGNWRIFDNQRGGSLTLASDLSNAEASGLVGYFEEYGFNLQSTSTTFNALGGQYLYFIAYDNDSGSGLSKYPKASETSNLQVSNGLIAYSAGFDQNGAVSSVENLGTATITPSGGWDI